MSKELFVSSTPHETKVAIVEDDQLSEIYYERENEYTLAGSIYKGRVTRVLPGMQSAFVNIGLERDAFLYVSDFLLEDDEDVEGLDQVVARARVVDVTAPGPGEERAETQAGPLEADAMIPPAESLGEAGAENQAAQASEAPARDNGQDQDREGARKWRGRRRRRGRGRFGEREDRGERGDSGDRGDQGNRPERVERTEHPAESAFGHRAESTPPQRPEPASERGHGEREASNRVPMVLPGESISKYQPAGAAETPVAARSSKPARPVNAAKPSTEFTFSPSEFSPDSMVLPGESISKYRGPGPSHRPLQVEQPPETQGEGAASSPAIKHAAPEPSPAGPRQQARHEMTQELPLAAEASPSSSFVPPPPPPGAESHPEVESEHHGFESANRTASGRDAIKAEDVVEEQLHEEIQEREIPSPHDGERFGEEHAQFEAGSGLIEEEEIEEEESELPGFEEAADLAEYEELEEEVIGPGNDQMVAAGSELTEAVRDAHINERATGQYEAEGLEVPEELEDIVEAFGLEEGEEDEGEAEAATDESGHGDLEGARAEHRASGTADYQQTQRSLRRPDDRRGGRRTGGRPMRGRRYQAPRRLPAISDLLKEGQEILVQIAKEPIAKKGARITSHIALPGRFLVYMPTVHHTGVSRKIASEEDRHRLKRIVLSERGEAHGGFIVRTAAAGANEDDLRADIRFLINLWNEIRGRAESSKAPALIYHDLNLVERILRDQVTTSFSTIWADTEQEYERILRFVSRFQPSLLKRVKLYSKETPLFEQFNITDEINKALKSKVWLKSGGYIVINQTEALVAIDVNTGKYVGKTARLEDTIVKTNIDAIREIVRQIRLRDLGGIIVIDFIDMDERKNRQKVMQALEDALRADRAPSKVLQFNDFGLVAITRKRVKQSLERTLGQPCPTCQATGMIKSVSTVCNEIYVEMRKMSRHFERDIMLRVNPEVAKALKSNASKWVQEIEELIGRTVLVKSDPLVHPEHFDIQ
ncbi:MAG TPA: Rne/Rng family ribonuclease [Terriglobales bacterium]